MPIRHFIVSVTISANSKIKNKIKKNNVIMAKYNHRSVNPNSMRSFFDFTLASNE